MSAGEDGYQSRSFTGDALTGETLLRFAYLDEAGISSPRHEPFLVVAGVLVQMDMQFRKVEAAVRALVDASGPEHHYLMGENYSFQAKELWHGTGAFPRDQYSRTARMDILGRLVDIIVENGLVVVFGYVNRADARQDLEMESSARNEQPTAKQVLQRELGMAYFRCIKRIEAYMRESAGAELCSVVFENNHETRGHISWLQQCLTVKVDKAGHYEQGEFFESHHIVEAPMFSDKKQSPVIQLADIAAFVLKRHLQKCSHIAPLFERLRPAISYRTISGDKVAAFRQPDMLLIMDNLAQKRRYDAEE